MIKKTIWFDLTTSMQWRGGIIGIVRAELEVARNIHLHNNDIRFFAEQNGIVHELSHEKLSWLWNSKNITEDYLKYRDSKVKDESESFSIFSTAELHAINKKDEFKKSNIGVINRLKSSIYILITLLPYKYQGVVSLLCYIPIKLLDVISFIYTRIKSFFYTPKQVLSRNSKPVDSTHSLLFSDGDILFSMGWMDSNKEITFSNIKAQKKIKISYLVYDLILINEQTKYLYNQVDSNRFRKYFEWISENSDLIIYGGNTAKKDGEKYQNKHNFNIPHSLYVKFGSNITTNQSDHLADHEILSKMSIDRPFIITVGTIEARKNHDVIYKAYALMYEQNVKNIPLLVIVGKAGYGSDDLVDNIRRDPRVKDNIKIISPSDEELDCLYRKCEFTLLPSLYEGWSLTLPESFGYGKLCICSDVEPLREIGEGLAVFVDKYAPQEWMDAILYYINNKNELCIAEKEIQTKWENTSWNACAKNINKALLETDCLYEDDNRKIIWFDITTSYIAWQGGVSGIIRTELVLAKELSKIANNVKYFYYKDGLIHIVDKSELSVIFDAKTIEEGYSRYQKNKLLSGANTHSNLIGDSYIYPELRDALHTSPSKAERLRYAGILFSSILPNNIGNKFLHLLYKYKNKILNNRVKNISGEKEKNRNESSFDLSSSPFRKDDIVVAVGIDWTRDSLEFIKQVKQRSGFKFIHLVYDLTPVITPQLHAKTTQEAYHDFLYYISQISDKVIYGGKTALLDGVNYQKKNKWRQPLSEYVKFGSDIQYFGNEQSDAEEILTKMGVNKPFIITVGTIEIRKNHESLYKAYLNLLEKNIEPPLLIIVGRPGWKVTQFIEHLNNDDRIKDYIIHLSPTDEQLRVLYQKCLFTVLPSMYEGWSLTLPESLSYGKFCLTSDVAPLRETGQDLVEYIHPWDVNTWGERIVHYYHNLNEVRVKEELIKSKWQRITWHDFAKDFLSKLNIDKGNMQ